MSELKNKFGKRLQELRKQKGYSQEYFAELIGISPRNLSKIETGKTFPSSDNLEKIINHLNCDTSTLFNFDYLVPQEVLLKRVISKITNFDADKLQMIYKFIQTIE